jgi:hypothetical protein
MIDNRAARRRGRSPILGVTETEQFLAAMSWQITEAETALHGGDAGHRVRSVGRWHRVDEQAAERLMRTSGEKLESRVGAGNDRVDQFVRKRRSFSHRCQFDLGPRAVVSPWLWCPIRRLSGRGCARSPAMWVSACRLRIRRSLRRLGGDPSPVARTVGRLSRSAELAALVVGRSSGTRPSSDARPGTPSRRCGLLPQ